MAENARTALLYGRLLGCVWRENSLQVHPAMLQFLHIYSLIGLTHPRCPACPYSVHHVPYCATSWPSCAIGCYAHSSFRIVLLMLRCNCQIFRICLFFLFVTVNVVVYYETLYILILTFPVVRGAERLSMAFL
ncbi:hypothetical protein BDR03DRAFT_958882 [Suillus americanus]|nr:hypothetical protein BDR03DRAFT_958882 [Suillus americanus]